MPSKVSHHPAALETAGANESLQAPSGTPNDPEAIELRRLGLPLTRANWMLLSYTGEPGDRAPVPFPAEMEAMLPDWARLDPGE